MSCTANALPGAEITWKKGSNVLSTGGIYEVGTATYSNDNTNFKVTKSLKIIAAASTVVATFQHCMLTSPSQSLAECKQSYRCSSVNGGVSSSAKSSAIEVKVTGLQGDNKYVLRVLVHHCVFHSVWHSFDSIAAIYY